MDTTLDVKFTSVFILGEGCDNLNLLQELNETKEKLFRAKADLKQEQSNYNSIKSRLAAKYDELETIKIELADANALIAELSKQMKQYKKSKVFDETVCRGCGGKKLLDQFLCMPCWIKWNQNKYGEY
jgi:hypothetical protein